MDRLTLDYTGLGEGDWTPGHTTPHPHTHTRTDTHTNGMCSVTWYLSALKDSRERTCKSEELDKVSGHLLQEHPHRPCLLPVSGKGGEGGELREGEEGEEGREDSECSVS